MAKPISTIFKFKGTFDDVTHVNSKRYGPHTRRRKGTVTPFVMTDALQESKDRLQSCNQQAKLIFGALRDEHHDGGLWSRILSLFFKELKAGRKLSVGCLQDFECNLQHKLEEIISGDFNISVKREQKKLHMGVGLSKHPKVTGKTPRTGYHLRLVVIYPDFVKGKCRKEVAMSALTSYTSALQTHELEVPMPSAKAPFVILMGICPSVQGKGIMTFKSDAVMKVVLTSETESE